MGIYNNLRRNIFTKGLSEFEEKSISESSTIMNKQGEDLLRITDRIAAMGPNLTQGEAEARRLYPKVLKNIEDTINDGKKTIVDSMDSGVPKLLSGGLVVGGVGVGGVLASKDNYGTGSAIGGGVGLLASGALSIANRRGALINAKRSLIAGMTPYSGRNKSDLEDIKKLLGM